ncbi:hypothetical protein L596_007225 [Steinernema carpocapsae]|uniref:KASH domain-containing protein n=1 Tax=Steinernema carpocapsae TaxID=34508 RepID=A0A4U5P8L0_STECR|nr:hypothetical protein L596_007225 [Steinernema carpocapsae]
MGMNTKFKRPKTKSKMFLFSNSEQPVHLHHPCLCGCDIYQEAIVLYHSSKEHQRENEQLDSDLKRVEALLSRKMEFFQRLEQLYDIVQELRRQNNDWKVINASEIDDVHAKIVELLEQSRKEFLPNGDSLEAEIEAINTSFFRSEYESIRDKFYTLRHELLEQCRLLEARNQFLGTVKAFCQLADRVDSTLKGLSGRGDSSFDENEIQRLTNELSELLSDVDSLGNKMIAEQNVADMTVKGVGMDEVLLRLRGAVPSAPSTVTRNRFDELEEFVGAVSSTCSVNSMDTKTDPIIATYTYILEQQAASSKEKDLVDEMEKVAESDDRREKLTRLRLKLRSRDEERTSKIEDAVSRFLAAIRKRYLGLDEHISKLISSGDKQLVDKVDSGPWSQWKVSLSEVERAVADSDIAQPLRSKVHDDFGKLEKDAFETDNKIRRFNEQWRRKQEKRKKLLLKLDAFGKWLDSIEEDLKKVEECGEDTERKNLEFRKLQENCLAYNRLVEKMENTNFDGGEQRIVDEYLRRYCDLTKKFDKDYLPRAHVVPITVDTKMSSMASDAPSMLSTGSASSVEPESTQVAERHLFEGASNLDSDGRSVEVLSQLNAVKSTKDVRNLLDKVAKICSDAVDDQYTIINSYGLKNVEEAEDDLNRLSQIRFTSKVWQKELVVLTGKLGHADSDLAKQLIHSFEVMDEPNQTLAKVLASEIEDEKALCSNYQKIMTGLNEIEETARNGDECITATTRRRLYSLEMNIDMLHLQCKEPRKYVRSSIDNSSKTSSPTRRKRIAVMVTSTVTTVIKVIEERLRLSPAGPDSEENKELAKLMRDLSILNNNVTKKNYADFEVPKLLEDLVSLTDSAKGIYDKIEKVRKQQGANDPKNTDRILTVARSGRAGLEDIVKKVDRIPVPAELTAQYRSVIVDLIDSILRIEDEMLLQPENLQGQNKVSEMLHMSEASRHQESTIVRSEKAAEACDISERYPMEAQRGEAVKETETSIKSMDVSQVQLIKPVLDLLSGSYQKPRNADVQKIQDERVQPSNNLVKERAEKDVANDEPRITAVQSKETELQNIIDPLKDNKQKRLIKENIESLVVQVDNAVRDAEAVEWNPEASLDEIASAIEKLNKANDDIGAMQSCYDKIDSAEPKNDSLRASALAKIETADQTVAPLKQALEDRLEKLNNELANLEKISGECKLAERDVNLAVASNASPDEFQAIVDSRLKPLEESLSAQQLSLTPSVVEKRDAVEKSLKDMREQTEKAINDAQEQQDLVDSLNDAINLVQSEVDQLREKYTESPRPLAESLEDSKKLKELLEKLVTVPVADIKIKPEREYLTRLADSVKSSIKELSGPLDTDARKEEDVLKNFNDTLTDLTAVGDAVLAFDPVAPADSAEARATQADVVSDLNEKLRQLKSRAENVHKDVEQPSKNIARNPEISKDNLPERVAQLQDELNKKKGDMAKRHVLDNVTPEVVAASDALQKRIDDVEQVPLGSIEDQEKTLNDLEKMKRQLETALEKVPEGPEGDELRARSQWDLSRLNDLLKRLSDAVGDKLAALAAFTATKDDVNAELDKIKTNNDKLKQKKTSDDEEPNPQSLTDRLEALKNQKSELDRLKNKVDNVDKSSLDSNSVAEIEALQKRIADVADEIAKNEKDAEKQLRDKLDSERQDAEAKRLLDDLAALMDRARQTLTDASALPTLYESLGKELEDATANASKTIEDIEPSKRDSGNVSQLLGQLPKASTLAEQINKRFAAWLDFVRERDNANVELDNLREPLDRIEEAPLRNLSEALKDLDELKTASAGVPVIKETTAKLQALCEQLDPLETAYADVRFFDVDVEQTERQYDELMTQLNKEADDENNLRDVSDELTGEVMALCAAVENADSVGVDQFKKELIPALAAQLKNRDARDEAAKKNRRHVARAPIPAEQHLQPIVEQLHAAIRDRLKQIAEDERQALLHSLDKQCELLKAAPTDELLKKVEAQLQQVAPKDDDKAHIDELRRQLEDARTEKERNDADKKKSEEQKHALQDALNSLDNSTQATDKFFAEPLGHTTVAELLPSVEAATETLKKDLDNVQTQTDAVPANSTVANDAKKKLTDGQKLLSLLETLLAKLKQKKDDAAKCEQKLDDAEKCVSDAEKNVDNSASPYKALPQPLIVGQKDLKTEKEQRPISKQLTMLKKFWTKPPNSLPNTWMRLKIPRSPTTKLKRSKSALTTSESITTLSFSNLKKMSTRRRALQI